MRYHQIKKLITKNNPIIIVVSMIKLNRIQNKLHWIKRVKVRIRIVSMDQRVKNWKEVLLKKEKVAVVYLIIKWTMIQLLNKKLLKQIKMV